MTAQVQAIAAKLAADAPLEPEDTAVVQQLIGKYGVSAVSKMLDATVGGLKQAVMPQEAPATPDSAEERAMMQGYGAPQGRAYRPDNRGSDGDGYVGDGDPY